jgi:SAM-dependent methyltransferase
VTADEVLASQIAYYRAHAPEYDDWWFCRGRHDLGPERRESWVTEIGSLREALTAAAPLGDVLEFAGGTGNWTRELTSLAESVTVVDASPEAVDITRRKVSGNVLWRLTDIFEFRPERTYDVVFFSFGCRTSLLNASLPSGNWWARASGRAAASFSWTTPILIGRLGLRPSSSALLGRPWAGRFGASTARPTWTPASLGGQQLTESRTS